jgi:uncharacterized lipoprotein YmbA
LLAALALLPACGTTPPARWFVLDPLEQVDAPASHPGLELALEPVVVPEMVQRPQLVTRVGPQELGLLEYARWSEPLEDSLTRVLAQDLALRLGTERVAIVPDERGAQGALRIAVRVLRFDATRGGDAVLDARWSLRDGEGAVLSTSRRRFSAPVTGGDPPDLVAALSSCVRELGQAVAQSVEDHLAAGGS